MAEYPQRDPYFAHRFVRMLQKSCAAMEIGQPACLLLCYIAHTEDAVRYRGPVKFWNEQLMTTMGFKSPKQLNDCRQKAVNAGWLVYERPGHRQVGKYWVTIPPEFEGVDDSVIEPIHSEYGTNTGTKTERIGDGSRNESVTESGKPSIPIPEPIPKKTQGKKFVPPDFDAVAAYCRERGNSIDPESFIDFYASKGWMIGKNKMKDWKAAVRTWESKEKTTERKIEPGSKEWQARSISYYDDVTKLWAMAEAGEITDEEYNRRCADLTGMEVPQ